MTEPLERDDLIGLLNRLGSDRDEEVLEAARQAHTRIAAACMTWDELLVPDEAAAARNEAEEAEAQVVRRAREILANLEGGEFDERGRPRLARRSGGGAPAQLEMFSPEPDPIHEALRGMEPESMTPIEALAELDRLRKQLEEME